MKKSTLCALGVVSFFSFSAWIHAEPMPKCFEGRNELPLMNEKVVQFKRTMPNLKKIQVFVKANFVNEMETVVNGYGRHQHFVVSLRDDKNDREGWIEIAHSMNGYTVPEVSDLKAGPIYFCAEYSTTDVNGHPKITKFKPSETGAMLHWSHQANRNSMDLPSSGHPNGWIYANGKVFGLFATQPKNK